MPEVLTKMYRDDADIIAQGVIYFRYSVITYFFLGLSLVCTIALRNVGQYLFVGEEDRCVWW